MCEPDKIHIAISRRPKAQGKVHILKPYRKSVTLHHAATLCNITSLTVYLRISCAKHMQLDEHHTSLAARINIAYALQAVHGPRRTWLLI